LLPLLIPLGSELTQAHAQAVRSAVPALLTWPAVQPHEAAPKPLDSGACPPTSPPLPTPESIQIQTQHAHEHKTMGSLHGRT